MLKEVLNIIMWISIVMCFMTAARIIGPPLEAIGVDEQLIWFIFGSWFGILVRDNTIKNSNNQNNP